MSPLLSLLLAAGIIVVGTVLVLAWNRWTTSRQQDGISTFAREMRALAPDRPLGIDSTDPDARVTPLEDGRTSDGPGPHRPGPEA